MSTRGGLGWDPRPTLSNRFTTPRTTHASSPSATPTATNSASSTPRDGRPDRPRAHRLLIDRREAPGRGDVGVVTTAPAGDATPRLPDERAGEQSQEQAADPDAVGGLPPQLVLRDQVGAVGRAERLRDRGQP